MARVGRKQGSEVSLIIRALLWGGLGVGIVVVAMHIGNARSAVRQRIPADPIAAIVDLVRGRLRWPHDATAVVIIEIAVVAIGVLVLIVARRFAMRGREVIDAKARFMGTGKALQSLTEAGVREKAEQLGFQLHSDDAPGVSIGISVADGIPLYGSYADLHLDIWGPQQGKSTCRAIPAIVEAIGAVIVTSNKRDLVDATRDVRAWKGSPGNVFVFDPEGITAGDESPSWFWDPLRWVDAARRGCEIRAAQLAGHFADYGSTTASDTFFDAEAEDLLANLFLAAAVACRPIVQVWEWITNWHNTEPIEILRQATPHWAHVVDLSLAASSLSVQYNTDRRIVSRVFGTAKKMIGCLKLSTVHPWITPGGDRKEFDELEFLQRSGTLYTLSAAGRGSAAPLVSALIEAVLNVAVEQNQARRSPRVPVLAVLDDAANVVLWRDLPRRYSYYGSHGIVLMTLLQSWAQGVRCWGSDGMSELWSAASIKVLGGGIDDVPFLRDRMEGIGSHDVETRSFTASIQSIGYSTSIGSTNTLGVSELRSLPRERAVLFASGAPPVLIRTVPWWQGPFETMIRHSLELYSPRRWNRVLLDDDFFDHQNDADPHPDTSNDQTDIPDAHPL